MTVKIHERHVLVEKARRQLAAFGRWCRRNGVSPAEEYMILAEHLAEKSALLVRSERKAED